MHTWYNRSCCPPFHFADGRVSDWSSRLWSGLGDGYFLQRALRVREQSARGVFFFFFSCRRGRQTKIAFISPAKINSAYVPRVCVCVCVCVRAWDVFVLIRLCLSSRAGRITWLHMLTDPNTCFSHRPAPLRAAVAPTSSPLSATSGPNPGTTMATHWTVLMVSLFFKGE